MRKFILGCLGVATAVVAVQFAQAGVQAGLFDRFSACNPCDAASNCGPCDEACNPCDKNMFSDPCAPACGKKSLFFLTGHMEAGVYANEYGNTDLHGHDITFGRRSLAGLGLLQAGNTDYMQNVRQTDAQVNQLYISGGKKRSKRGWDWGGQIDYMFGTDARLAQSEGLEFGAGHGIGNNTHPEGAWGSGDYFSALPQMFAEIGYNNLSVKAGKFYTPLGHEGLNSDSRFFYSLSNAFAMNPVTHSGVLATWEGRKLTVYGGWVNGENKFFNTSDDNAFLGGFKYALNKRINIGYGVMIGSDDTNEFSRTWRRRGTEHNVYQDGQDYFVQSFVVDVKLNKRWDYAFEWTLRNNNGEAGNSVSTDRTSFAEWSKSRSGAYGINNELIYKINKKWAVGFRAEWANAYRVEHDYVSWTVGNRERVRHERNGGDVDVYSFTLGANWTPRSWLVVRPEMRYDRFDGTLGGVDRIEPFSEKGFDGETRNKQFSGGVSAIVKF